MARAIGWLAVVCVVGCGSTSVGPGDAGSDGGDAGIADSGHNPVIQWAACSLASEGNDGKAECATVEVPLDWKDPDGRKITVYVKRARATKQPSRQLWLLAGGPGMNAHPFEDDAARFAMRDPSLDIYLLDHRGTGMSTRLACPAEEDPGSPGGVAVTLTELKPCSDALVAKWGALDAFSTTNAAEDLAHLIDWTRAPSQPTFVYGLSYGSYWAQRYLQVRSAQATGVIIDGVVPGNRKLVGPDNVNDNQSGWDGAFKRLLDACGADTFCASKLGNDPFGKVPQALGACTSVGSASAVKAQFSRLLTPWQERELIPAIVYRRLRCSAADQAALQNVSTAVAAMKTGTPPYWSEVLFRNVVFSDLWGEPSPSGQQLLALDAASFVPQGWSNVRSTWSWWPRYKDPLSGSLPSTSVPMLMLNGTLDPRTGIDVAKTVALAYTKPTQRFYDVPWATHGVVTVSALSPSDDDPAKPCGQDMLFSFMDHPEQGADTTCIAKIPAPTFKGDAALAQTYLGTTDIWE